MRRRLFHLCFQLIKINIPINTIYQHQYSHCDICALSLTIKFENIKIYLQKSIIPVNSQNINYILMEQGPIFRLPKRRNRQQIIQEQILELMVQRLKQAVNITSKKQDRKAAQNDTSEYDKKSQNEQPLISPKIAKDDSIDSTEAQMAHSQIEQDQNQLPSCSQVNSFHDYGEPHRAEQEKDELKQLNVRTSWNNFILVPNIQSCWVNFTCGVCEKSFIRADAFVHHCIQFCGHLHHSNSSHFIEIKMAQIQPSISQEQLRNIQSYRQQKQLQEIPIQINESYISLVEDGQNWQNFINQSHETVDEEQASEKKERFIRIIKEKEAQIKSYSEKLVANWNKKSKVYKFIYRKNYFYSHSKFIIMVNPEKKNITQLNQQTKNCKRKSNIHTLFLFHLFGKCCPINAPSSNYLILWADTFYKYLYQTNKLPKETPLRPQDVDIMYLKYLYESTLLTSSIDTIYPLFKYFLGLIQALSFAQGLTNRCKICGFEGINMNSVWANLFAHNSSKQNAKLSCEYNKHYSTCSLYNKPNVGILLIKHYSTVSNPYTNLLNIQGIEKYTFFCPVCANLPQKMSADKLISHLQKKHNDVNAQVHLVNYCKSVFRKYRKYKKGV